MEVIMIRQTDVNNVRKVMSNHIGSRVKVVANKGRHKVDITEGVISQIYPSIFLVEVTGGIEDTIRMLSFSYTDVITKDVRLSLCS